MSGRRRSPETLRVELAEVEALIAAHPLASRPVRAAHEVIEAGPTRDAAAVDRELAARGLPSVEQLGRAQVAGTWSWWRLHRRKRKLLRAARRAG